MIGRSLLPGLPILICVLACGPKQTTGPATDETTPPEERVAANPGSGDRDGDGIADDVDQCPDAAETANGIDDGDGCPETDIDRDGIVGSADKCPSDPEDKDGYEDDDGCPDVDGDKDGVADENDQCPDEMENINGYKDADGCADVIPPPIRKLVGTIPEIGFGSGSAKLLRSSFPTLNNAARVFVKYPEARFEIQGHTDNEGSRDTNVALSQKRADAVRAYLIKRGVKADRLLAKGYGPDAPKADNGTKAGRAENRRVDFKLISDTN